MRRATLNVSLTPELLAFITAQVTSGRYGTASEVVRAALRSLEQRQPPPHIGKKHLNKCVPVPA